MQDSHGPDETQSPPPSDSPPSSTPPPAESPPPVPPASSGARTLMLVLSYFGIFALIPLLVEKEDEEVQWHARHGLILLATWILLWIALLVLALIPVIGWVIGILTGCVAGPFIGLAILVIHIICIVKAINGEKFRLPVISEFADR